MDDEPTPTRSKWLPIAVLGTGTVLIAAPLVYLWRIGRPQSISLRSAPAAPPRRVGALSSGSAASTVAGRFTLPEPEFPLSKATLPPPKPQNSDWDDDADWGVPAAPPDPKDNFNSAFYTFKAFGAATLIVGSLAVGGIWGLTRFLDVDNTEDFGVEMRRAVMERMPLLALRMRNALGSSDSTAKPKSHSEPPWAWDDAEGRLAAAFDKGGLGAWADAAAREVEAEAKLEIEKRERLKEASPSKAG
ncbi:hypothetical protein DFH07DRAFT_854342 [Mycena maculata]|uniref:Transmembrane protein n=1 Tax=Mycena maculata TaxID=230809 RepID=A0AAD7HQ77_9AGAR|nr:hypothetical protein DFH07DRAFT_854342 [Mycena maculata]